MNSIIQEIMAANLFNPHAGYDVDEDLICDYLNLYPIICDITDRVTHFKQWLNGDFS